jgi:O-antigen ligase
MRLKMITVSSLLWLFVFFQSCVTLVFLGTRADKFFPFGMYLQGVKYSTLLLLVISAFALMNKRQSIFLFDPVKYTFALQIIILYFAMIIHTDIKAINSPTILLMLISALAVFGNQISFKTINLIAITLSFLNFTIVMLQILSIVPVAQDNVREGLNLISDRPTGLLFNAFAMGYASVITFAICLYFVNIKKLVILNLIGVLFSVTSVLLSVTRTPLLLMIISGILILLQKTKFVSNNWKLLTLAIPGGVALFPLATVVLGNLIGNQDMATLNGRTFLWDCVTSRWQQFIPFGVGVQGAFPQGFCSDDEWFSKLRHPENMFLLNYVESGLLGLIGLVLLFIVSFWFSGKALAKGSALPMAVSATFLMSSIFYVPLFHYLPFLENRTADRGVFNFYLFTILWMAIMNSSRLEKEQQLSKKR